MEIYDTHSGVKTIKTMRREIASASGDQGWYSFVWHSDADVIAKYLELGRDKFGNPGWVDEIY
jgi:hypothetical protein